jgi:hypothetical protein
VKFLRLLGTFLPYLFNHTFNIFLPKFDSYTQRQKLLLFKCLISHAIIQSEIRNFFRTSKYSLEQKCE